MPKYENSVIYKLKHNEDYDDTNIYVGSTSNFKNRKNGHKTNCNNEKSKDFNKIAYQFIRDNDGWDNWVMIPIEEYPCNSKKELEVRERHHIDLLRPVLNIVKPGRTNKEYYEDNKEYLNEIKKKYENDNKEKLLEYRKIYREDNKEKILEYNKKYYEDNKEIILENLKKHYEANKEQIVEYRKIYRKNNKEKYAEKHKKWYEANKEQMKEKQRQYQKANKEQKAEKAKEKVICDHCGCEVRKYGLNKHQQTKKCINFVKTE